MRKRSKQPHTGRGVSLPVEVSEQVDRRLEELQPRVKSFSHYVQLLVDWDLNRRGEPKPFNSTNGQHVGLAA